MAGQQKITYVTLFADPTIHPNYERALKEVESKYLGRSYPLYIGDEEVWTGDEFDDRSPIDTSILVGRFQRARREHIAKAIEVADSAFGEWSELDWKERVKVMERAAQIIDERKFEIAAVITYEVGKNRLEALAECWEAVDAIRYYCRVMEENNGYQRDLGPGAPGEFCRMVARPYGAWVVISPFNFPFMLANGMMLGALITGNTVVFKPTSEAPLSGLLLYRVYRDAGVPPGAISFLTGPGDFFEEEVTTNPKVAGIAFTGSKGVGMRLYRRFLTNQPYPKPVVLEMGSKNPTIVTDKADLQKAVTGVIRAAFGYGGQKCSATSRLYVHYRVYDKFIEELVKEASRLKVGDPREREAFMGPVINRRALENFKAYVDEARRAGAQVLFGGEVMDYEPYNKGFYVQPTIIAGLPDGHRLWREELFLPILLVASFRSLDEALQMANDTEYGLTAGIFSEDREEVDRFFGRIRFGVCYANRRGGSTTGAWPGAQTFVGWKASGATGKGVGGPHYLLTFLREQSRTIVVE
ncbi:MAG: aldehyde dehydrogenase family protein [Thaumarchaeota archaeon]|nr:aldehyde dehydrogenase family protein [Candidatus Calditenuaceae archaeon]MDW8186853.1 aldehyde dehydrogenase family protein [Nitrososphaerota archaeon]